MKWVWDESAGQYIQIEDTDSRAEDALVDEKQIKYLDENKQRFDKARDEMMSRLAGQKNITGSTGPYRSFAMMYYYKSLFTNEDIDSVMKNDALSNIPSEHEKKEYVIKNYVQNKIIDSDLIKYIDNKKEADAIHNAFLNNQDLMQFDRFNPKEMESGSTTYLNNLKTANVQTSELMKNLSNNINQMVKTNRLFYNGDVKQYKILLDASRDLQKLLKKNPNIGFDDKKFKDAFDKVASCAEVYSKVNGIGERQPGRLNCTLDLINSCKAIKKTTVFTEPEKTEEKQRQEEREWHEQKLNEDPKKMLEHRKKQTAKYFAKEYAKKQGYDLTTMEGKKYVGKTTEEFLNAEWFTEIADKMTLEDATPNPGAAGKRNPMLSALFVAYAKNVLNPPKSVEQQNPAPTKQVEAPQKGGSEAKTRGLQFK